MIRSQGSLGFRVLGCKPPAHAGGGYTKNNVARCWTYETAVLVDAEIPEELPPNTYYEYYAPDHKLNLKYTNSFENANTRAEVEAIKAAVMENLRHLVHTPGQLPSFLFTF